MLALLALALSAGPAFTQPPALTLSASEDSDEQALVDLCRLPGAQLELETRSNMLATGTLEALSRCKRPIILWRLPSLPAQRERLEKLPSAELLFDLPEGSTLSWTMVSALGPRRIHLRAHGRLTSERAAALERFRNAEVELDLRGRIPDADELAQFRRLDRAGRSLRISSDAPPELLAGLEALQPERVTLETAQNQLPLPLLRALEASKLPATVELAWPFTAEDARALASIPRLSLAVKLGTVDDAPRALVHALAPLEPDDSKPASTPPR